MKWCIILLSMRMQNSFLGRSGELILRAKFHINRGYSDPLFYLNEWRYDAHPMAILTSAFAYLGSYYREANPSLQGSGCLLSFRDYTGINATRIFSGQTLFTKGTKESLAVMDRQIYRLIGKATTLAAWVVTKPWAAVLWLAETEYRMAYRVRQGREFVTPPTGLSYTGS